MSIGRRIGQHVRTDPAFAEVDFGKLRKLKDAISKLNGIKSVSQRSFDAPSAAETKP